MKENNQFVTVAEVAFMHQADFVKNILENAGYEAFIFDETSCNVLPLPALESGGHIKIQVDEKNAAEAKQLLKENNCAEYLVEE